jgi:predicted metal-dependent hydrolase
MQISPLKGLEIIVPRGINSSQVQKFVKDHHDWIAKKLPARREEILYLGNKVTIQTINIPLSKYFEFQFKENVLTIEGDFERKYNLTALYENWLYLKAREVLAKRAHHLAQQHGFKPAKITIRRQTSRWGSCSARGNISLNYKLLKHPGEIIDYVILHELCHLIQLNHSPKFWNLLRTYIPEYKILRKQLKSI